MTTVNYTNGQDNAVPITLDADNISLEVNNGTATQSGVIKETGGSFGFTKIGVATLTITAVNTYTGTSTIDDGTLLVTGTIVAATDVASGGTLSGTGTVGAINVASGGTLAPGNSGDGSFATGDITLVSGAKFSVTLGFTNNINYGQANTTGTVQLGGSTLDFTISNTEAVEITRFITIIVNDGSDQVEGLFKPYYSDMQVTVDGYGTTVDYTGGDGNDVVMTIYSKDATDGTNTIDIVDADTTVDGEALPTNLPDMIFGNGGDDRLSSLGGRDYVHGGADNDVIRGGAGSDILKGGRGADRLEGGTGGDVLEGGGAADRLSGGAGIDTFVFRHGESLDRIADYRPGEQDSSSPRRHSQGSARRACSRPSSSTSAPRRKRPTITSSTMPPAAGSSTPAAARRPTIPGPSPGLAPASRISTVTTSWSSEPAHRRGRKRRTSHGTA